MLGDRRSLSVDPPGRLPMLIDGDCLRGGGEGDLGGLEGRGRASTGGSGAAIVVWDGVWLLDE